MNEELEDSKGLRKKGKDDNVNISPPSPPLPPLSLSPSPTNKA